MLPFSASLWVTPHYYYYYDNKTAMLTVAEGIWLTLVSITLMFEIEKSLAVTVVPDAITQFIIRKIPVPKPVVVAPAKVTVLLAEL